MPKLKIDGTEVEVPGGTNLVEAAKRIGVEVPVFCYHPKLSIAAQCRMCLVEVEKMPKLVPACQTIATEGMVVATKSPRVKAAQAGVMELLLLNHPVDCPICDQAGECLLQDYFMLHDLTASRSTVGKVHKPKVQRIGGGIVLDSERCVMCTRCIRYFEEITGEAQMGYFWRGEHVEVSTFPGEPLHGSYCGNAVDLCPVGALTWEDFRFKCRAWFLAKTPSVCPGCARGCNVTVEHHDGTVFRMKPRENEAVNGCWMCDDGRLAYKFVNDGRILGPLVREGDGLVAESWERALAEAGERMARALSAAGPDAVGVVLSPQATLEDNRDMVHFASRYLGASAFFVAGKPAGEGDNFLRRADKNPNRAGVRAALGSGADALKEFGEFLAAARSGKVVAAIVMGHDVPVTPREIPAMRETLRRLEPLIVIASNHSPLTDAATVVLPSATFAEKSGTFVNEAGLDQPIATAFPPRGRSLPETAIIARLAVQMGYSFRPPASAQRGESSPSSVGGAP